MVPSVNGTVFTSNNIKEGLTNLTTLNGDNIYVNKSLSGSAFIWSSAHTTIGKINYFDNKTAFGVVHIIDTVLFPASFQIQNETLDLEKYFQNRTMPVLINLIKIQGDDAIELHVVFEQDKREQHDCYAAIQR